VAYRSLALRLLSAWRAADHTVGVDTYVRVLELLGKLPADTPPAQLKTLLAPLFATDREQQTAFYLLFDRLLPEWQRAQRAAQHRRQWLWGSIAALLLAAAVAGVWWWKNQQLTPTTTTAPGTEQPTDLNDLADTTATAPLPDAPPPTPARDTLLIKDFQHTPDISALKIREIPPFSLKYAYWDGTKTLLAALLALLLAALGWWLNRLRYRRELREVEARRNLGTQATDLKRKPSDKPPFVWQFRWNNPLECYADEDLAEITPRLRSRSAGDYERLDGPRTVHATVRNAGRISFRYRRPTQPDEFLLLIDMRSANDHRARLFDAIYQHLRRNEVLIERYFYRQDPRFCWNEQAGSATTLHDLHQRYPAHRLVVVGTGSAFLSKTDGDWLPWTAILEQWRYRTLLSTINPAQWSADEQRLAGRFRIVPASLAGLSDLSDNASAEENNDLQRWRNTPDDSADALRLPDALSSAAMMANLEAEYTDYRPEGTDQRLLCWLAATALSPVLHWDATRFFAEVTEQHDPRPNEPLFTPLQLQRLCRLPWFAQGRMPDNARRALLQWLHTEQPQLLERLRHAWQQLLEEQLEQLRQQATAQGLPPFEETVAYEQLRLTMLVNELTLDDLRLQLPRSQRLQLERELRELSQHTEPDLVALELLENAEAREAQATGTVEEEIPPPPEGGGAAIIAALERSMIPIPAGTFRMGSDDKDKDARDNEKPAHEVTLRAFSMGRTEVTNAQYAAFLNEKGNQKEGGTEWIDLSGKTTSEKCRIESNDGKTFSVKKGYENHPVIYVSWYGAKAFAQWLSQKTGKNYRLPTEAEWEYSARGGPKWTDGFVYAGSNNLNEVGWYSANAGSKTHPVASEKKANQLGLYDMSGNVWEWCEDDWHGDYKGAPEDGSAWIEKGSRGEFRVLRGGSWLFDARFCRSAYRGYSGPTYRSNNLGFRLVLQ
jgi:formylglycine-generating enzyme required for sulfatase activity